MKTTARPAGVQFGLSCKAPPASPAPITAAELGVGTTRAGQLLEVATARIARYAPGAPEAVKREAVIRFAGWLLEAPAAGERSERTGDLGTDYSPSMTGGFRASGAAGLLAPWRVRRAGAI